MSGSSVLNQNIPQPSVAVFDTDSGLMAPIWYRFFLSLFTRTGGSIGTAGVPGGVNGNVQFNNAGAFGGLTDVQLTALVDVFTTGNKGAVPPSGGTAGTFLEATGAFTVPPVTGAGGPAGGDLSGTYPNPTVAKVHGVAYPTAPATGTVPVVTGSNVVTYTATTGTGDVARAVAPTFTGATVDGSGSFHLTTQTSGAGVATGTLTNAPHAGPPDFWVSVPVNGVVGWMPWWHA